MDVLIGVDVGQKVDPTAVAVVEHQWRGERKREGFDDHYVVRHLERLPLMTPYPKVAERLGEIVGSVKSRRYQVRVPIAAGYHEIKEYAAAVVLYVDATGVGQPVVDLLAASGARPIACYFTHGDRRLRESQQVSIGKAWLVSRLQALLQTDRIHLPETAEARVLAKELLDYEIKVDQDANDKYGAFKVGTHDDLVTALGLATQEDVSFGLALSRAFASQGG